MKKTRPTAERIIGKLREAEGVLARGGTVGQGCKQIGVKEQTCYRSDPTARWATTPQTQKLWRLGWSRQGERTGRDYHTSGYDTWGQFPSLPAGAP